MNETEDIKKERKESFKIPAVGFKWEPLNFDFALKSLYNTGLLVFISKIVCVYSAVRTESLNIIQAGLGFWMLVIRFVKSVNFLN
jgi:hypothetical protein